MMSARRYGFTAGALASAQFVALGAHAHHPTGGQVPSSLLEGLLSGIGHPILGLDHLAFVVGIGLLAAIAGYGLVLPALFVVAMACGLALHVAGIGIPNVEILLACSVVLIGAAVIRPRASSGSRLEAGLFALAGLLHGHALAETAIGAEPTPVLAYIVGLAATQMLIAAAVYMLARTAPSGQRVLAPVSVRALGVVIAATGATFLVLSSGLMA